MCEECEEETEIERVGARKRGGALPQAEIDLNTMVYHIKTTKSNSPTNTAQMHQRGTTAALAGYVSSWPLSPILASLFLIPF